MGQIDVALSSFRDQAAELERVLHPGGSNLPALTLGEAIHDAQKVAADATCDLRSRIDHRQIAVWLEELDAWRRFARKTDHQPDDCE